MVYPAYYTPRLCHTTYCSVGKEKLFSPYPSGFLAKTPLGSDYCLFNLIIVPVIKDNRSKAEVEYYVNLLYT